MGCMLTLTRNFLLVQIQLKREADYFVTDYVSVCVEGVWMRCFVVFLY